MFSIQLTEHGIEDKFITFTNTTMGSDKWICVQRTSEDRGNEIVIVDLRPTTPKIVRHKITADSAIIHPTHCILALKGMFIVWYKFCCNQLINSHLLSVWGPNWSWWCTQIGNRNLQVYNMEQQTKLQASTMPDSVEYWKWISDSTIAWVSNTAVYHWVVIGKLIFFFCWCLSSFKWQLLTHSYNSDPVSLTAPSREILTKVMIRHEDLASCQIINYLVTEHADPNKQWSCLIGLTAKYVLITSTWIITGW